MGFSVLIKTRFLPTLRNLQHLSPAPRFIHYNAYLSIARSLPTHHFHFTLLDINASWRDSGVPIIRIIEEDLATLLRKRNRDLSLHAFGGTALQPLALTSSRANIPVKLQP